MSDPRLAGFVPVIELMQGMQDKGIPYPSFRLSFADDPVVFSMCGPKSRQPGAVNLTDGASYNNNKWYGRISSDGVLYAGEAMRNLSQKQKDELWELLKRLREGEAEKVFEEYGHAHGMCAICTRELKNKESIRRGIGPVCYERAFGRNKNG